MTADRSSVSIKTRRSGAFTGKRAQWPRTYKMSQKLDYVIIDLISVVRPKLTQRPTIKLEHQGLGLPVMVPDNAALSRSVSANYLHVQISPLAEPVHA